MTTEDLSKCPQCGGPADNGHDRCHPPTAYLCSECLGGGTDKLDVSEMAPYEEKLYPLLIDLYLDVRAYFRYEAEPLRQQKRERVMRETMYKVLLAMEEREDDTW